jgi:RNA polymerase sigma factor (sigma-70 family)
MTLLDFRRPSRSEWIRDAIDQHQGRLIRFAARITGDLELARDVVQETFLRLCREDPGRLANPTAWLFRVCRHRALDQRRKDRPMHQLEDAAVVPVPGPGVQAGLEREEVARAVLAALGELDAHVQEVLRLRFQDELSYRDIAEVTGRSVSHVGVLIHGGIRELRRRLAENDATERRRARA